MLATASYAALSTSSWTETRSTRPPFGACWRGSGVKPLVLYAWSPNLNAFAERFVEAAKSECLERIVPLGEGHLRAAVRAFVQHYHGERPHQALGNELIAQTTMSIGTGTVACRARLGGFSSSIVSSRNSSVRGTAGCGEDPAASFRPGDGLRDAC